MTALIDAWHAYRVASIEAAVHFWVLFHVTYALRRRVRKVR